MTGLEHLGCKVAVSAANFVVKEVGKLLKEEILRVWNADKKFRELQAAYLHTEALLGKLDRLQIRETTLETWLHDLDRYCYDVEDIVDDLMILGLLIQEENRKQGQHPVRSRLIKSRRLTIPHQIEELRKKLKEIGDLIEKVLPTEVINSTQPQNGGMQPSVPFLLSDKTPLVPRTSRDNDKQAIVSKLTSEKSEYCGVSIIGMDGLGKTSLVRTILDDGGVKQRLPFVLSACVSGPFQRDGIVKKLLEDHSTRTMQQNPHQPTESCQTDPIHCLHKLLGSTESALIVLDDVWSVKVGDWDYFKDNCLSSCPGWKILITTRNPDVAKVTMSSYFYLNRMRDEDCKELIIQKGNLNINESRNCSDDIAVVAKKCMGIPILANQIGLTLSRERMGADRKKSITQLKNRNLWEWEEFKEVFPSLNLNEPKLPADLKRCFAYCSLFPPSFEYNKEDLIQLWDVEGFIHPQLTTGSSKQRIKQTFDDLSSRSIFQPLESRDKRQTVYKMHEFNHEFAHILASQTFCRYGEGTPSLLPRCINLRHLSLACQNTNRSLLEDIEKCESLRTFLLVHHSKHTKRTISYNFFHKLHRLRLLDLSHTDMDKLPKPIFPSKHLRFLDLSYTLVKELPKSIASLCALKVLKLKGCPVSLQLPKDLNQLINLTHLHVDMKDLRCKPSNLGELTKLEVLDSFFVGKEEGHKVLELRNMKDLEEIHIFGLENINDMVEAKGAMLREKTKLRILRLEWDIGTPTATVTDTSDILEGLEPHVDLEDLQVRNYSGKKFPTWLISSSFQLVSLTLDNCPNCNVLPSLAKLPILTNLVLRSIDDVKSVDHQFCGKGEGEYPYLELLEFHNMKGLVEWTGLKKGGMPRLRALKIFGCPMLKNVPSFEYLSCLMNLEINNCPQLQSLPTLPASLNSDSGELVINDCPVVKTRCVADGADWPKIKDIHYVEIDRDKILPKAASQPQAEKGEVSMDDHQLPISTILAIGNDVSRDPTTLQTPNNGPNDSQNIESQRQQPCVEVSSCESKGKQKMEEGSSSNQVVHHVDSMQQNGTLSMEKIEHSSVEQGEVHDQNEATKSQSCPATPPSLGGESSTSLNQGAANEDQLTSHQLQSTTITTTNQTTTKGDDLQNQGTTNGDQPTLHQPLSTPNATTVPTTTKDDGLQGKVQTKNGDPPLHRNNSSQEHQRKPKRPSSGGFLTNLFTCFRKGHEKAPSSEKSPKHK